MDNIKDLPDQMDENGSESEAVGDIAKFSPEKEQLE